MVFFLSSVHAKIIDLSAFVICGNPLDRDSEVEATTNEESFLPSLYTFAALITAPSIQLTIAVFLFIHSMSTRPMVLSSLTFTGSENVAEDFRVDVPIDIKDHLCMLLFTFYFKHTCVYSHDYRAYTHQYCTGGRTKEDSQLV